MHTVVETNAYLSDAKALDEDDRRRIVDHLANNPEAGKEIGHGIRKVRIGREGGGKSGGFRVLTAYFDENYPVYLLIVFAKNDIENISKSEAKDIADEVKKIKSTIAEKRKAK